MDILIINVQSQTARMAFQQRQMAALGLKWERLDAVSTHSLREETYQSLANTWERPMRKAEVCCFLSHHTAWQEVLKRQQPCLILEDDAVLANFVPQLLTQLELQQGLDMVNLEVRARKKIIGNRPITSLGYAALWALYQDRTGTGGYVLWPDGARKLMEKAARGIAGNADAFISSTYTIHACQVEPAAVIQLDMCEHYGVTPPTHTETSISNSAKPPADKGHGWRFKLRRIAAQLRMGWRALTVLHKAQRRFIHLNPQHFT